MKPQYKIVTRADGIERTYYTHEFYSAMTLFNTLTREMPYAEVWEGTRMIQNYDGLNFLLA